jgi:hypothetical protein
MKRHIFAVVVGVLFVILPGRDLVILASGPAYTVEDLGTIDGLVPTVTGINASGQVTGFTRSGSIRRAVRFTDGPGWEYIPGVNATHSLATAINASGDVAGYHLVGLNLRAFRYTNAGVLTTLSVLPGGNFTVGLSINAAGVMTGHGDSSLGTRGWRSVPGSMSEVYPEMLPTLGGGLGMSCGINDAGQIAGLATNAAGHQHAYRIDPKADGTGFDVTDVVPFGGDEGMGRACAINASGRVGGNSIDGNASRAFVSAGGPSVNVDAFGSDQSTVESMSGDVSVGWFVAAGALRAFVHTDADGSADLNTLIGPDTGWHLQQAFAVNTAGKIAGNGMLAMPGPLGTPINVRRAFRLKPTADTRAPVISAVSATPSTVWPPNGQLVDVAVSVTATDNLDPAPVCAVSSISAAGGTADDFSFTGLAARVRAVGGSTYTLDVTCADETGNVSPAFSTTVVVPRDTTAPVISAVSATPSTVWPPKGQVVDVTVAVTATDDVDAAPVCAVSSISATGGTAEDFSFTGLAARVRALGGTTYTLNVTCTDAAGNVSPVSSTAVFITPDTTAPVISIVHATPGALWPPNGKMVSVTVTVRASDDVDSAPQCSLTSVTSNGGAAADAVVTGQFTADLRAEKNGDGTVRVYNLNVTCADRAKNASADAVTVFVARDAADVTALGRTKSKR